MMDLEGKSLNRVYSIKGKKGESRFYEIWEATSIYSATILDLHIYKHSLTSLSDNVFENIKASFFKLMDIQTPYLYMPFEIDSIDDSFYLAYPQINSTSLKDLVDSGVVFPYEIALKIVINILRGLAILEKKNLQHNLLSAETVWLTESGLEITNIKISGFLDQFLLDPRDKTEQSPALDIKNLGLLLFQLLTGKRSSKQDNLSFGKSIPSWVSDTTETMLKNPGSFDSIQILLDLFLSKAPAHSILEDSIKDRIAKSAPPISTTEDSVDSDLEELRSPQEGQTAAPFKKEKVKEFVAFILSFFRRKKKTDTPGESASEIIVQEEQDKNLLNEENTVSIKNKTDSEPYIQDADFSNRIESEQQQLDPWQVEENRYKDTRSESPSSSAIPLYHNKPDTESQLNDPDRYKTETPVQADPSKMDTTHKSLQSAEPPVTAEERIKMLKQHRESTSEANKTVHDSPDLNKRKEEKVLTQQQKQEEDEQVNERQQPIEIPEGEIAADSGQSFEQPVSTLLQRIIRFVKNLFQSVKKIL